MGEGGAVRKFCVPFLVICWVPYDYASPVISGWTWQSWSFIWDWARISLKLEGPRVRPWNARVKLSSNLTTYSYFLPVYQTWGTKFKILFLWQRLWYATWGPKGRSVFLKKRQNNILITFEYFMLLCTLTAKTKAKIKWKRERGWYDCQHLSLNRWQLPIYYIELG